MDTLNAIDPSHAAKAKELADAGVRYVTASWADIFGRNRAKSHPVGMLPELMAGPRVVRLAPVRSRLASDATAVLATLRRGAGARQSSWLSRLAGRIVRGCQVDPGIVGRG